MGVGWCLAVVWCVVGVAQGRVLGGFGVNEVEDDGELEKREVGEDFGVESGREGSKDMLFPILFGLVAKAVSVIPVFLTSIALVAGYSLATSKVALVMGAVLVFYHYLSTGHPLLTQGSKDWRHLMPAWSSTLLGYPGYHPSVAGHPGVGFHPHVGALPGVDYHRDRNDRQYKSRL